MPLLVLEQPLVGCRPHFRIRRQDVAIDLIPSPIGRAARDAATIVAAAPIGELLERIAVGHELAFELRLQRRA